MEEPKYLSGQLLLAMPGIGDPRFEKAVIAMCVHDDSGALGIGLGRIVPRIGFHELLRQMGIEPGVAPDVPIHLGGPVEPQRGFLLHSTDWGGDESIQVGDRWCLTATLDILRAISEGGGPPAGSRRSAMPAGAPASSSRRCAATAGSQPPAASPCSTSAMSTPAGPPPSGAQASIPVSWLPISAPPEAHIKISLYL